MDYHHEKYAVVALARYLVDVEGWSTVLVGVRPDSLDAPDGPVGHQVPLIDAQQDTADPRYRYNFYTDTGGIDLVATKDGQVLLVEAKGKSAKGSVGIEQLVGRTVLAMKPDRPDYSYAVLMPDLPHLLRMVESASNTILSQIRVFVISPSGDIRRVEWGRAPSTDG